MLCYISIIPQQANEHIKCRFVRTYAIDGETRKPFESDESRSQLHRNQSGMTYPTIFRCFFRWECVGGALWVMPRHFMWKEIHYWFPFIDLLFIKFCAAPMVSRFICCRNVCQLHDKKNIQFHLWLYGLPFVRLCCRSKKTQPLIHSQLTFEDKQKQCHWQHIAQPDGK